MNFKNIHIGLFIKNIIGEREIETGNICNSLNVSEDQILQMFDSDKLDTEVLLRWSKLLQYDFFRLYSQHLVLYSPPGSAGNHQIKEKNKHKIHPKPKSIYTKEVIEFILESIEMGEKTDSEIIDEYRIPKTTLFKWKKKYRD